jgi:hypothetical protein
MKKKLVSYLVGGMPILRNLSEAEYKEILKLTDESKNDTNDTYKILKVDGVFVD